LQLHSKQALERQTGQLRELALWRRCTICAGCSYLAVASTVQATSAPSTTISAADVSGIGEDIGCKDAATGTAVATISTVTANNGGVAAFTARTTSAAIAAKGAREAGHGHGSFGAQINGTSVATCATGSTNTSSPAVCRRISGLTTGAAYTTCATRSVDVGSIDVAFEFGGCYRTTYTATTTSAAQSTSASCSRGSITATSSGITEAAQTSASRYIIGIQQRGSELDHSASTTDTS
jgi:hypothetical protein